MNLSSRIQAAKLYQETGNASQTAREVGVHRATIMRWLKEPDFLNAASLPIPEEPEPEDEETIGLKLMAPKAMQVLDDALEGKKVTNSQIRAAMEVLRASNALKAKTPKGESLAERIAQLDSETDGLDGD